MTGPNLLTTGDMRKPIKSLNGFGNAFAHGPPSGNPAYCNSPLVLRVCPSMDSKICKAPMDLGALPSRSRVIPTACLGATHASTDWISLHIKITRAWKRNFYMQLSRFLFSSERRCLSFETEFYSLRETEGFTQE